MSKFYVTKELSDKLRSKGYFDNYQGCFNLPRIDEVLAWLREEKKLHIMMATYSHYPNNTHDWGYEILNLQTYTCELYRCRFNSYEQAAIAGIEYVLDNLI